ncbi:MAG: hypothetical protein M0R51_15820, partial [Clostridia bacterium]|nr:hypothetical protein [Clostridia bacterium]
MENTTVKNTDGFIMPWDRQTIVNQIVKETKLSEIFYNKPAATVEEAQAVAQKAEDLILKLNIQQVSGPLIREVVNSVLLEEGKAEWRNIMTRVGASVYDAYEIDSGYGFEANDNANQLNNAETSHKRKADKMSKEQNLLLMPERLANTHLGGSLHVHDLEYLGTRPFCIPDTEVLLVRRSGEVFMVYPSQCIVGDEFYTPNGWRHVKFRTERQHIGDTITINTTQGGFITTTPEHRIPTQTGVKPCGDLKVSEVLPVPTLSSIEGSKNISDATALFLGTFIANGHTRHDGGYFIVISDNDPITEEIVLNFAKERDYHVCVSKPDGKVPQFIITRKELYQELCETHKICTGASKKSLPVDMLNMPLKTQKLIICGMFFGDGSVFLQEKHSSLTVYYKTVSKTLMQQFSLWLRLNNIPHSVRCNPPVTTGAIVGRYPMYIISINRSGLGSMMFIGKQEETLQKFNTTVKPMYRKPIVNKIRSIKVEEFNGTVYDFGLEDSPIDADHLFLAGSGVYIHNCQDWDARYFFYYGLIPDGIGTQSSIAKPAKNAEVAILQLVKALGSAQTNFAGGEGLYNFLTFLAPYFEGKSEKEIKQLMQMFVYEMMQMFCARGGQVIFSSVQLTPGVNNLWKDKPIVAFGKVHDGTQAPLRTYGEFEREVRLSFKTLMDVMIEGDAIGKPFSFPKPEISMEADFMQEDEEFNKNNPDMLSYHDLYLKAFELAAKFGTPYFDNQLPEYRSAKGGISCYQCCAYQFSATPEDDAEFENKMYFRNGAHFSMGSWMVMSLNCPRVAYEAEHNDEKLFKGLRTLMDNAIEIFKVKRKWMDNLITKGRIPFASQRPRDPNTGEIGSMAVDFDSLVYTIGVIGINEMVQYHTGYQIHESKAAYKLAIRAM